MSEPFTTVQPSKRAPEGRLDSWKEIAAYLKRDVTTVRRWEKREGMPVHRHVHDKRGSVYAVGSELDAWQQNRGARLEPETGAAAVSEDRRQRERDRFGWVVLAAVAVICLVAVTYVGWRWHARKAEQPKIRSLAVLPLKNMSGEPGQDYLADGMTDAIIGRLSGLHDLRVISYTSVMRFKNPQLSLPEISKKLGVDAIVEGSVMREGDRIRVTAQLIRGATDEHFWSETYDRELRDALPMQSEIALAIAEKVKVTLTGEEQQRLTAARPVAPEVYDSYLKGVFANNGSTSRANMEEAKADFEDAIRKDPTFAPAYLGLADAYMSLGIFAGDSPEQTRPQAMSAVRKALELDQNLAEAHVMLASVLQEEWHWAEAETEFRRALDLNPNDGLAHGSFAMWLLCQGRIEESVAWVKRGRELDPVVVNGGSVSWILFQSHRFDEALRETRGLLKVSPNDAGALLAMGVALSAKNQDEEAVPLLEKAVSLSNGTPLVMGVLVRAYAHAGRRADALRVLAELKERNKKGYVPTAAFVNAYLGLGDNEEAFVWLEKAYKEKSDILQYVKVYPYFDPIRNDPRFVDLVRRVGLG